MPAPLYFRSRTLFCLLTLAAPLAGVAQTYTPITVTGFNRDIIFENDGTQFADSFDIADVWGGDPWTFHEVGVLDSATGLPTSRTIVSAANSNITFQLADYNTSNALFLSKNATAGPTTGTLTLATPTRLSHLAILAISANGGGYGTMTLNFSNGFSSTLLTYTAWDWYAESSEKAYHIGGRYSLQDSNVEESEGNSPYLYQTAFDVRPYIPSEIYEAFFLTSITFTIPPSGNENLTTAIFAISGVNITAVPEPSTYALASALVCLIAIIKRTKSRQGR